MPKSDNKKQVIVQSALKLFADNGYASTPISMIAKHAKVSQGLLYNFFSGKQELLQEIVKMGFEDIALSMQAYSHVTVPKKAIEAHVTATIEIIRRKREFWRLLHGLRLQGSVLKDGREQFKEITMTVTATFEKVFRKLQVDNPRLEAILFLTQIDGLVILYLQDESIPLKKLGNQIIKRYTK